jgi:hypothetical protein
VSVFSLKKLGVINSSLHFAFFVLYFLFAFLLIASLLSCSHPLALFSGPRQFIMSVPVPHTNPAQNVVVDTASLASSSSQSVWDRISNWVSENKAIVYTLAGVAVVVTGAGVVYYLSDAKKTRQAPSASRKSDNQRRKGKKKADEERKAQGTEGAPAGIFHCHRNFGSPIRMLMPF